MAYITGASTAASGFDILPAEGIPAVFEPGFGDQNYGGSVVTYDIVPAEIDLAEVLYAPHIYAGDTLTTPPKKGTKLYAGLGASVPTEIGMAYVGDANGVPVPWFG